MTKSRINPAHLTFSILILSILFLLLAFTPSHAQAAEKLYQVLQGNAGPAQTIKEVWSGLISFMNYAAIGVLIFIAFANILRININTYGIKKFLPTLVLALILANFSYFICRIFIDLSNIVMDALVNGPGGVGINVGTKDFGIAGAFNFDATTMQNELVINGAFQWGNLFKFLVYTLLEFAGVIVILILAFLFFIRNYIIYFLVALSPLAFLATVLPQSKGMFNTWWSNFLKWVFMPVVSLFWLWVGTKFAHTLGTSTTLLGIAFAFACYYLAITTPFKMGGGIMNQWKGWSEKIGKKAWGATGAQAVKGGKWVVGGGAASMAQAHYQSKAKTAKNFGRKEEQEKYERLADSAAALNPMTYTKAVKERLAFGSAQREKAITKSGLYNKIVGGAKQIDVMKEITASDWKDASEFEAGEGAGQLMKALQGSTKQNVKDIMSQRQKEVDALNVARQAVGMAAFTPEEERTALTDRTLRWFRVTSSQDIEDTLGVANDPKLSRKTLAEATNIAGAWSRKSARQYHKNRELGLASGMSSSLVGEQISPFNPEQTTMLEQAAMAGEDNVKEIAKRVGVDEGNPQQLEELRAHYGRISEALNGAVEQEMEGIREEIDGKLVGARHAFDLSRGGMGLDAVERNTTEGLSKIDAGDIDGARAVATKLGLTDIEGDTSANELKKRFTDIREGVGLVGQSGLQATGDWASFDKAVREKLSGGE